MNRKSPLGNFIDPVFDISLWCSSKSDKHLIILCRLPLPILAGRIGMQQDYQKHKNVFKVQFKMQTSSSKLSASKDAVTLACISTWSMTNQDSVFFFSESPSFFFHLSSSVLFLLSKKEFLLYISTSFSKF